MSPTTRLPALGPSCLLVLSSKRNNKENIIVVTRVLWTTPRPCKRETLANQKGKRLAKQRIIYEQLTGKTIKRPS
jgi:hypothetical protein